MSAPPGRCTRLGRTPDRTGKYSYSLDTPSLRSVHVAICSPRVFRWCRRWNSNPHGFPCLLGQSRSHKYILPGEGSRGDRRRDSSPTGRMENRESMPKKRSSCVIRTRCYRKDRRSNQSRLPDPHCKRMTTPISARPRSIFASGSVMDVPVARTPTITPAIEINHRIMRSPPHISRLGCRPTSRTSILNANFAPLHNHWKIYGIGTLSPVGATNL